MKSIITTAALVLCATLSHAAPVSIPSNGNLVDLGSFQAGAYKLTGSGSIALCSYNTFVVGPDGVSLADYPVTCAGGGGTYNEPSSSYDGSFGPAGPHAYIGALVATLNPNAYTGSNPSESQADDWFLVGYGTTITLTAPSHIYAALNDMYVSNNSGAFQISVEAVGAAVPEPATAALTLSGLLGIATIRRRRAGAQSRS